MDLNCLSSLSKSNATVIMKLLLIIMQQKDLKSIEISLGR